MGSTAQSSRAGDARAEAQNSDGKTNEVPVKRGAAFDQLVLPPGHKDMVLSLIAQHFRDKESAARSAEQVDIVRGKGATCPIAKSTSDSHSHREGPDSPPTRRSRGGQDNHSG